jgi:hypothetical protein
MMCRGASGTGAAATAEADRKRAVREVAHVRV